ncbi:MAG TPA: single-stranded DNA-binding protein, partial [Psychromonas sp.]
MKINNLSATGNIGRDAELRFTAETPTKPNGEAVAQFSFALTSGYGDKAITTWINCNLWGKRAETLAPMLLKGTQIGITGELTNRPYKDKQGNEKYSLELRVNDITLLGKRLENSNAQETRKAEPSLPDDKFEDDIPF